MLVLFHFALLAQALSEPGQQRVRLAAGVLDTGVGALGVVVLGLQLGAADHVHVLGWMIGALISLGAVAYAAGLLAWRGGQAVGLRILGWVLMVMALVIPSTLTLALPLVALLATTLARLPEQQVAQGPVHNLTGLRNRRRHRRRSLLA